MNRKTLVSAIIGLLLLVGVIAWGVGKLFSGGERPAGDTPKVAVGDYRLLPSVPADAAMLMTFSGIDDAVLTLGDTTKTFAPFLSDNGKRGFLDFMLALGRDIPFAFKGSEVIISMHYSGELQPLMLLAAPADSTQDVSRLVSVADSNGVYSRYFTSSHLREVMDRYQSFSTSQQKLLRSGLVMVSPSQTLLTASERHLESGTSILDKRGFPEIAAKMGGDDALFVNCDYASKIFGSLVGRDYTRYYSFLAGLSDWVGLRLDESSSRTLVMDVETSSLGGPSFYDTILGEYPQGDLRYTDVLPYNTLFAVGLATPSITSYLDSYRLSLDAKGRLDRYRQNNASLKDTLGITPEQMVIRLGVKEAVKGSIRLENAVEGVLALRINKPEAGILLKGSGLSQMREYKGEIREFLYKGFIAAEFGGLFSLPDEGYFFYRNSWLFVGSRRVLSFLQDSSDKTLGKFLQEAGLGDRLPDKTSTAHVYFSLSEYPPILDALFKEPLAKALRKTLEGISYSPLTFQCNGQVGRLAVDRVTVTRSSAPVVEKDTTVLVPKGPFRVYNTTLGRVCILSQAPNNSIQLREESGKGIWAIPFRNRICGYVENIDFYGNGRIQWLFAAGQNLYLYDNGARTVTGFPVDLGKEVLLGPEAYDLDNEGDYRVMILHTDNTIGFYDLRGRPSEGWEGITSDETIKTLPEAIFVDGEVIWVVRTSIQTLFFPFSGGKPLSKGSRTPMVRPDTEIEVNGNGTVQVTCYDGKVRSIRLERASDKPSRRELRAQRKAEKQRAREEKERQENE